jgi:hypothetical protein
MMVYSCSPATRAATNGGAANTEFDVFQFRPGVRNVSLQAFYVIGKGAGLTAISGNSFCVITLTTPGAAGTAITPAPKDPGMEAAKASASSSPTLGSTGRINRIVFGCGAAGPGGWVAPNQDSLEAVQVGSGTGSTDVVQLSGTATLPFEWSGEIVE